MSPAIENKQIFLLRDKWKNPLPPKWLPKRKIGPLSRLQSFLLDVNFIADCKVKSSMGCAVFSIEGVFRIIRSNAHLGQVDFTYVKRLVWNICLYLARLGE